MNESGKTDDVPMVMPWLFSKPFRKQHPQKVKEIKDRFTKNYLTKKSAAFKRQLNANVMHDTRNQLRKIKMPTLILVGKNDELTPTNMAEELSTELPNSELLIFDRGGHGLYWEVPELFNESVIDFIRQHEEEIH